MKRNLPQWLQRMALDWEFYWSNLRASIYFISLAVLFLCLAFYENWGGNASKTGDYLFSIGSNLLLIGIFSILYEVRTRESFRTMLAEINPNIESGVTVHPSHKKAISREDAIEIHLKRKEIFRLKTSTADHYVEAEEAAHAALLNKIADGCTLKILLSLPIFQDEKVATGRHGKKPDKVIHRQKELLDDYQKLIKSASDRVTIKFFFSSLHMNYFMLGDNRMYSSLIPNGPDSGIGTPCFEIFPTGSDSLFFKFQQEFEDVFKSSDSLMFEHVEPLLRSYSGDIAKLRKKVLAKITQLKSESPSAG